jgi:hypothetical protein
MTGHSRYTRQGNSWYANNSRSASNSRDSRNVRNTCSEGLSTTVGVAVRAGTPATARNLMFTAKRATATAGPYSHTKESWHIRGRQQQRGRQNQ